LSTYETIRFDDPDADGVARIMLHRPERLNAFTRRRRAARLRLHEAGDSRGERAAIATPEFAMRVPEDLPAAYPWWDPDQWST
jgi:enoyl-CoA hydratase/carnithine racemase